MISSIPCDFVQIEIVGIGVPSHFHIHLIPRMEGECIPESDYKTYLDREEKKIAMKISAQL